MERRLAAILAADVVGYSKMIREDEAGTLSRLKRMWADVFSVAVDGHGGRIFKMMGDGALVEFASVVDAVECAAEIQAALADSGEAEPGQAPLELRIGINLGDIVIDGDDILGDGVNIAARLEAVAPPGGVLASDTAHNEVRGKVNISFIDAGEVNLKNIDRPLRVWRWLHTAPDLPGQPQGVAVETRPTLAVLPFDNMSRDPDQDFLADGLSEDIITALSRIRWFQVIARNSTFTYKGRAVDVKEIGRELGARYVIEGSIRKAGNRIRVTVQLIDADTGAHVWAERYDRDLEDIFELQDEITATIVGAVEPELSKIERAKARARPPDNLGAWEYYQRGVWHMWNYDEQNCAEALRLLDRARQLDPGFAPAHAYYCYCQYQTVIMGWTKDKEATLSLGMAAARQALESDEVEPAAYFAIGRIQMMQGDHGEAIASLERSVSLNPSFSHAYHGLGMALVLDGQLDRAREALVKSELLSPRDPILWASQVVHALADVLAGDIADALEWSRKGLRSPKSKGYWPHAVYAAALWCDGQAEEAAAQMALALQEKPDLTRTYLRETLPTTHPDGLKPYLEALTSAGMPE